MDTKKQAREVISSLKNGPFFVECPCCEDSVRLRDAGLFYLGEFTPEAKKLLEERKTGLKETEKELKERRRAMPEKSERGAKSVNIGFILERLAPSLSQFRFNRNDCRSLFEPIDYLIFEGLTLTGKVNRIIFSDIKTGKARLQNSQKQIRELVARKRVSWDTYKTGETR